MAEAGFLDPKPIRPGAAATVILLHGAAVGALLLIKNPEVVRQVFPPTTIIPVRVDPLPPPPPPPQPEKPLVRETYVTAPPIPSPVPSPFVVPPSPPVPPPSTGELSGTRDEGRPYVPPRPVVENPPPTPPPPREVVRTEARMTSGDLQPPYPTAEQRLEREGRVVIRVTIGTDGRVTSAQKVSATSDAFYTATERHARSRWRFRPATVDGRPVETTKTLTVVFQLNA
ncbi:MAG TPA: energy transducer TonB [Allosphingosinicella sp.]|nr:energy transducer TonB [Allosphingosinicella sp.]